MSGIDQAAKNAGAIGCSAVLFLGGGLIVWLGIAEFFLAAQSDAEPQVITCRQLGDEGPGENAYVRVTDCVVRTDAFWVDAGQVNGTPDAWHTAWIPLSPRGEGSLPFFRVILRSHLVRNDAAVRRLAEANEIEGMVVNAVTGLTKEERKHMLSYTSGMWPGAYSRGTLDDVWIVEHGRTPSSPWYAGALLMLGAACLVWSIRIFRRIAQSPHEEAEDGPNAVQEEGEYES